MTFLPQQLTGLQPPYTQVQLLRIAQLYSDMRTLSPMPEEMHIRVKCIKMSELPDVVTHYALTRVRNGESCIDVIRDHGIDPQNAFVRELEKAAFQGPARERIRQGQSCKTVAKLHGIHSPSVLNTLEYISMKGPAGRAVKCGLPCHRAAKRYGIRMHIETGKKTSITRARNPIYTELQNCIITDNFTGIASLVARGKSCDDLARQFGIGQHSKAYFWLKTISKTLRPAVLAVLNGASCINATQEKRHCLSSPFHAFLVKIFVSELAEKQIRRGVTCGELVKKHGIKYLALREQRDKLELMAVEARLEKRVREGESCIALATEEGVFLQGEGIIAMEMIAIENGAGQRVREGISCPVAAKERGIRRRGKGIDALEWIAVNEGGAGMQVRNGESYITVAKKRGIRSGSIAFSELEMIAVETAEARVRAVERCIEAAAVLGIPLEAAPLC